MKTCCTQQKKILIGEKRDAFFHQRVFRSAPDRAVFSVAIIKLVDGGFLVCFDDVLMKDD